MCLWSFFLLRLILQNRKHLTPYRTSGGWGDVGYDLLKELDKAGLILTSLVYLDDENGFEVTLEDGLLYEEVVLEESCLDSA